MDALNLPTRILLWAVPVIFAVTVHEVAHGVAAGYLGDRTARQTGRLSLNPLRHVDLIGSIVVPAVLLWIGGFVFGWARPVPVDTGKLHVPKRDIALVAIAGPLSNIAMLLAWVAILKIGVWVYASGLPYVGSVLLYTGAAGIFINSALLMLNLLPLPPLDGGRVLISLLPDRIGRSLLHLEPWGLPVLLVLIVTGHLGQLIWPMMVVGMAAATYLVGLPVGVLTDALRVMLG